MARGRRGGHRAPGRTGRLEFPYIASREFAIVVPLTGEGHTMLIRSYKHGIRGISRSFPAGYLEAGEEPLAGAKRELLGKMELEQITWDDAVAALRRGEMKQLASAAALGLAALARDRAAAQLGAGEVF